MDAQALAQALLRAAIDAGAAHAEVWCKTRRTHPVTAGTPGSTTTTPVAVLSVWTSDGRRGVAWGAANAELATRALEASSASTVQRRAQLPVALPGLGLVDARAVSDAMMAETLEEITADAADAGGKVVLARLERVDDDVVWASSSLGHVREPARHWHLGLEVVAPGKGAPTRVRTATRTRSWATMASLPFGQQAAKRSLMLATARETVRVACPAVLTPSASSTLLRWLAEQVESACTAAVPPWLHRTGEVVHPKIHLRDDGLSVGGMRTASFDAFGDPPRARQLFAEARWCDGYAAPGDPDETRATGHVGADTRLRHRGLSMPAGLRSVHALQAELGAPLVRIDELPDLGPGSETRPVALSGTLWQGTRLQGAFRDQTFLIDPLRMAREILAVSSETDRHDEIDAPALVVGGLTPALKA